MCASLLSADYVDFLEACFNFLFDVTYLDIDIHWEPRETLRSACWSWELISGVAFYQSLLALALFKSPLAFSRCPASLLVIFYYAALPWTPWTRPLPTRTREASTLLPFGWIFHYMLLWPLYQCPCTMYQQLLYPKFVVELPGAKQCAKGVTLALFICIAILEDGFVMHIYWASIIWQGTQWYWQQKMKTHITYVSLKAYF